ncbi:MAG: hypothetical protein CSA42_06690 [Gammaproteobacteria bacterium]|nr:MAG: hypothetical protein CSA42_06690 [Gammaproteobacteria bacterium]
MKFLKSKQVLSVVSQKKLADKMASYKPIAYALVVVGLSVTGMAEAAYKSKPLAANTTEIIFKPGEFCGYYIGDLSKNHTLRLNLDADQEIVIPVFDRHTVEYVKDPEGVLLYDEGGRDNYKYFTESKGYHNILLSGKKNAVVGICVY